MTPLVRGAGIPGARAHSQVAGTWPDLQCHVPDGDELHFLFSKNGHPVFADSLGGHFPHNPGHYFGAKVRINGCFSGLRLFNGGTIHFDMVSCSAVAPNALDFSFDCAEIDT